MAKPKFQLKQRVKTGLFSGAGTIVSRVEHLHAPPSYLVVHETEHSGTPTPGWMSEDDLVRANTPPPYFSASAAAAPVASPNARARRQLRKRRRPSQVTRRGTDTSEKTDTPMTDGAYRARRRKAKARPKRPAKAQRKSKSKR